MSGKPLTAPAPTAVLLTAVLLSATGCGAHTRAAPAVGPPQPSSCVRAPASTAALPGVGTDLKREPVVEVPDAPPPCALQVSDVVTGRGTAAQEGDRLTVRYVGVRYADGVVVDRSWAGGPDRTFAFALGGGEVIVGWDRGIDGMRVGGRRVLTIPAGLAYGAAGRPPQVPGGATLLFVVDLVGIG